MEHPPLKQRRRWSVEQVLEEIRKLENRSAKKVQRTYSSLYGAAVRHFGSWKAAVKEAGFGYPSESEGKRKWPGQWSKELVIEEIRKLEHRNSGHVRKANPGLYNAALRLFDSWREAVEAAGFDYKNERKGWIVGDHNFGGWKKS